MAPEVYFPNLGIEISSLNRVAFDIFGLDVYWYGIIITMGIVLGIYLAARVAKKSGQNENLYYDFALLVIIASIVGARLYYVVFKWDYYKDNLDKILALRDGGIAIYGGIIAAIITGVIYTKVKRIHFGLFADTVIPSLALGQAIGRWGNFFNKEAFGGHTNNLFTMGIRDDAASYIPEGMTEIAYKGAQYIHVHPTFLYESLWNLILFCILLWYRKYKKYNGEVFVLYIIGYALGRFWIEGLRTDQLLFWNTNIAVSQVLSVILLAGALIYEIYKLFLAKRLTRID